MNVPVKRFVEQSDVLVSYALGKLAKYDLLTPYIDATVGQLSNDTTEQLMCYGLAFAIAKTLYYRKHIETKFSWGATAVAPYFGAVAGLKNILCFTAGYVNFDESLSPELFAIPFGGIEFSLANALIPSRKKEESYDVLDDHLTE